MADIGGGAIKSQKATKAWGVNPANAEVEVVIDDPGNFLLGEGDYVALQFGAITTFFGIITRLETSVSEGSGQMVNFTLLDNRIRLQWAVVTGAWNIEDQRTNGSAGRGDAAVPNIGTDSGSPPGSDSVDFGEVPGGLGATSSPGMAVPASPQAGRRKYRHQPPEMTAAGIWLETDAPLSAREILNSAFGGAWGSYSFARSYHPSMDDIYPLGIDATDGMKLHSLVAQVTEACGLEVRLDGARTLVWGRKGDGLLPIIPSTTAGSRRIGRSLTANDTAVMVVGDANVVQVLNLELEADWNREYEAFIDEAAWVREVASVFEIDTDTKAKRAELMAKSREITLLEYATKLEDDAFLDYGMFGASSRLHIPVWTYVQELVFRSYRIPRDYVFGGVPLNSLRVAPKILWGTEVTGSGLSAKQRYRRDYKAYYPDVRVELAVRGQPLDLVDGRSIQVFSERRTTNLRDQWVPFQDFEFDDITMAVRFRTPIFLDGNPAEDKALYSLVNKGKGGGVDVTSEVEEGSSYLDIVIPNPNYEVSPAGVKVSLAWELGKYRKVRGTGARRGSMKVPGLAMHLLDVSEDSGLAAAELAAVSGNPAFLPSLGGIEMKEIKMESGLTAEEVADAASDGVIQLLPVEDDGNYERFGEGGASLTNTIDRVTIEIGEGGLKETVEFTKARPSASFMAERLVARLQRVGELFPGQAALQREIEAYRLEAKLQAGAAAERRSSTHKRIKDVASVPVGAEVQSTAQYIDELDAAPDGGWKAGHIVWLDDQGRPAGDGVVFGGIVVSTPAQKDSDAEKVILNCATQGVVPVICEAGVVDQVWCEKGNRFGRQTGSYFLGELRHANPVPDVPDLSQPAVRAMVALGFGGGVSEEACGFQEIRAGEAGAGSDSADMDWIITGGSIAAGPKVFGVDPHKIALNADGKYRYFLRVNVTVNTNDGVAWPGIETASAPEWERVPAAAGYPESFLPTNIETQGDVIIPLMLVDIDGGVPKLIQREGVCSPIVIDHCLGKIIFFGTPRLVGPALIVDGSDSAL